MECIESVWNSLAAKAVENLVKSTHKRTVEVLMRQGRYIDYYRLIKTEILAWKRKKGSLFYDPKHSL